MTTREIRSVRIMWSDGGQMEVSPVLLHMIPDRLALARALVADMPGVVVGRVPDEMQQPAGHTSKIIAGWNGCRAVMIVNGETSE